MERLSNEMATRPPQKNGRETLATREQLPRSYAAKVSEILEKTRAGSPSQLLDEEFKFVVGTWVEAFAGIIPEHRLNDCYLHAARTRDSSFPMSVTDMCAAWNQIQAAERSMPAIGTHDWDRAREVCPRCNNTGTELVVKRDPILMRDYTYGRPCKILNP